jgi:hypothetical protein
MQKSVRTAHVHRIGVICCAVGVLLASAALLMPAGASPGNQFQGICVGTMNAGTCVLDEPEGQDPATHGTVTYLRVGDMLTFTIQSADPISEVQICMQASGPFAQAANACAGIHGYHVAFTNLLNVYSVDLKDEGFDATDPLYWTLHVVAGGRTLQVMPNAYQSPTTTTTTASTTTTTIPPTTTTASTTTTTIPPTTTTASTTTTSTTTTTIPPTTTTLPGTTTTQPEGTTTTVTNETTTTVPETTTTTEPAVTTTTLPSTTTSVQGGQIDNTTTTTSGSQVLGETLARTGGPRGITMLSGLALMLLGAVIISLSRYGQPVYPER